ncbi:hypothetical protein R70723_10450 [Paenibacillus sp. FSL R7-0273]|uniref:hypothetical protein n=1 Tax=Paenibacillus sp. FSL R7-0273 TaxID=1536772 RepID=UPI0004F80F61|nr:hypothetical protein [Paenibacillus sp. FSL R7-0273]AIQ46252.1 hypothetical protein R70723_10450 [Paenibacillus sp. FSL R7-0273]OMF89360.1 hypothetical protein BK144_19495 [Paenibacillus sp. FSL R7-0273]
MKRKHLRIILISLVLLLGIYVLFFGLPWKSIALKKQFKIYLEDKYQTEFKLSKMDFDFMHRTYLTYASPINDPTLVFFVGQDIEDKKIHDLYQYELNKRKAGGK